MEFINMGTYMYPMGEGGVPYVHIFWIEVCCPAGS